MNDINFTGSFLIKQPSTVLLNKFYNEVLPKSKRTIVPDVAKKGNVLVTVKGAYDKEIAEYLLKKPFNFTYYPEASLQKGFDAYYPKEAKKILDLETVVLSKRNDILEYIKKLSYSKKPITYKWKPNDNIEQSLKALKLSPEKCIINTKNNITSIYNKEDNRLLARISPNNNYGVSYAFLYPRFSNDPVKMAVINYNGELKISTNIEELDKFKKAFKQALKMERGRQYPTK